MRQTELSDLISRSAAIQALEPCGDKCASVASFKTFLKNRPSVAVSTKERAAILCPGCGKAMELCASSSVRCYNYRCRSCGWQSPVRSTEEEATFCASVRACGGTRTNTAAEESEHDIG